MNRIRLWIRKLGARLYDWTVEDFDETILQLQDQASQAAYYYNKYRDLKFILDDLQQVQYEAQRQAELKAALTIKKPKKRAIKRKD